MIAVGRPGMALAFVIACGSAWTSTSDAVAVPAVGAPPRVDARPAPRARLGGAPTSRNLAAVADRVASRRCRLLLVGDSIATHLVGDPERGTWVNGIWRTWKPRRWQGRFIPGTGHSDVVNGTRLVGSGEAPGFDPAMESLGPSGPRLPGSSAAPFDLGWWSLPVHPFTTTGDLGDRSLARFEVLASLQGRDYAARYRTDPHWASGPLRGTALLVGEPGGLDRVACRGWRGGRPVTETVDFDLSDALPAAGTDLLAVSLDLQPGAAGEDVAFEVRTAVDEVEAPGRTWCALGALVERADRDDGLLLGSTSCGGDTTRVHLPEGEDIGQGPDSLRRRYTDDYLRRFIELAGWDTFVITLGTNDLKSFLRPPAEVVADLEAVIDRYRDAAEAAAEVRPDLQPPLFIVISPMTAESADNGPAFEALDEAVGGLAGGDVAVVHLHALFEEAAGDWSGYRDQLLVDPTHPNQVGGLLMTELVWDEIEAVLDEPSPDTGDPLRRVPVEYPDLATATESLVAEDVVLLSPGTWSGDGRFDAPDVLLCSTRGRPGTIVSGAGTTGVVTVDVEPGSSVRLRDVALVDGVAERGAGVFVQRGGVQLRGVAIERCEATLAGGAIGGDDVDVVLEDSTIRSCTAGVGGGGIDLGTGSCRVVDSEIVDCQALEGGGVRVRGGTLEFLGGRVATNQAHAGGGVHSTGPVEATGVELLSNRADGDGGGGLLAGAVWISEATIRGNVAGGAGGGLRLQGPSNKTILQSDLEDDVAGGAGGGLSIDAAGDGVVEVRGVRFLRLEAGTSAAGVQVIDGRLRLEACAFETLAAPTCRAIEALAGDVTVAGSVFCTDAAEFCGMVVDGGGNQWLEGCDDVCEGDLNLDGRVDGGDLGLLFASWGDCPPLDYCRADLDRDGGVDGVDLGLMLAFFNGAGCGG